MKRFFILALSVFAVEASAATPPATIPEPSNLALLGMGFMAFLIASWRNRHK